MGISERKEREKQRRIKEIVDAAEKVFFSKGFKNATMEEIAEKAELSKGTLYLYFSSKDHLYGQIMKRSCKILFDRFEDAAAQRKLGADKVDAIGDAYYLFYLEEQDYFNVMINFESKHLSEEDFVAMKTEENCNPHAVLIDSIITGIKDGSIREDVKPVETALILWSFTTGLLQMTSQKKDLLEKGYNMQIDGIIAQACNILDYGIRK